MLDSWLAPPRLWEFNGIQADEHPRRFAGTARTYGAWGHTPAEAFTAFTDKPDWFTDAMGDWDEQINAMKLDPVTVTVDDRVWPDPEPVFAVNTLAG